jgi:hypothetical protein
MGDKIGDKIVDMPFPEKDDASPEMLSEYTRDTLSGREKRSVRKHLKQSQSSRRLAGQLEETWELLDEWKDTSPPADAVNRFQARLQQYKAEERALETPKILGSRRWNPAPLLIPLAWAAAVVLVLVTTFYQMNPSPDTTIVARENSATIDSLAGKNTSEAVETIVVAAPKEEMPLIPPSLRESNPFFFKQLSSHTEVARLFREGSPRVRSVLDAEASGVMFDQVATVLDLGSSHDIEQAMASVVGQLDRYITTASSMPSGSIER